MNAKINWVDLAKQFEHDTDLLGAFKRLWDRSIAWAEAEARKAQADKAQADYDLLVGDAADAKVAFEQQVQREIVNLGAKSLEAIPAMVAAILSAFL